MFFAISFEGKKSSVDKLFSCCDEGTFPNDAPCVMLLYQNHVYNVWDYNSLFNEVDCPKIGRKCLWGSAVRYKKRFCLRCIVSYSNDFCTCVKDDVIAVSKTFQIMFRQVLFMMNYSAMIVVDIFLTNFVLNHIGRTS